MSQHELEETNAVWFSVGESAAIFVCDENKKKMFIELTFYKLFIGCLNGFYELNIRVKI